jgi:hypothetical protein
LRIYLKAIQSVLEARPKLQSNSLAAGKEEIFVFWTKKKPPRFLSAAPVIRFAYDDKKHTLKCHLKARKIPHFQNKFSALCHAVPDGTTDFPNLLVNMP